MLRYIAQRLILILFILLAVSFFSFMLIHLIPGDVCAVVLTFGCTPAARVILNKQLYLNHGILAQYVHYLNNVLHGNFGTSFVTGVPVKTLIAGALPIDAELAVISQIMALAIAFPLAFRTARKPGGVIDKIATSAAFFFLSIPTFVIVSLGLDDLVATHLGWPDTAPYSYLPGGNWFHNFLIMLAPSFCIALGSWVLYFRLLRADLISTYQEEFITMARSKGLSRRRIVWRHAFRPSSVALLSSFGLTIGGLIGGLFIIEFLTGIPGIGYDLLSAIGQVDYITVQGIVLVLSSITVIISFIVDLLFGFVDPRIARE